MSPLFRLCLSLSLSCWMAATACALEAPSAAQLKPFWDSAEDDEPRKRNTIKKENEGQHFLYCDELFLDLFAAPLQGIGGGYVGVGSDQGYLMAGWMRAEWAWFSDYDPVVVRLHRIYGAFFQEAASPEEFLALWRDAQKGSAVIATRLAQAPDLAATQSLYKQQRSSVLRRMAYLKTRLAKAKVKAYVNDNDEYAFIRQLVMQRRARPMLGNLLADKGLRGIAAAARHMGVKISVLYISNAEQYWTYGETFRGNVRDLPLAETSWVARTSAVKPVNGDYRYYLQHGATFQSQLGDAKIRSVGQVISHVPLNGNRTIPLIQTDATGKRTVTWANGSAKKWVGKPTDGGDDSKPAQPPAEAK